MEVKKTIIRESGDVNARRDYEREAGICPHCGASGLFDVSSALEEVTWTTFYSCRVCGCEWSVPRFREKKPEKESFWKRFFGR